MVSLEIMQNLVGSAVSCFEFMSFLNFKIKSRVGTCLNSVGEQRTHELVPSSS